MFNLIKRLIKPTKRPGNSLTFLLMSVATISVSLSVTSVALGPMISQQLNGSVNVAGVQDVAAHHLDRIQRYIQDNPEQFLETTAWNAAEGHPSDSLPDFQKFQIDATNFDTFFDTAGLRTFTENIRISNIPVTVTSTVTWDAPVKSVIRLSTQPYSNVLYITVRATAGGTTVDVSRKIAVSPATCINDKAPTPVGINVPYDAAEDTNFQISDISGPYFKIGTHRICAMPAKGQTSDLSCLFVSGAGGIDLIYGGADTVGTDESRTFITFTPSTLVLTLNYSEAGTAIAPQTITLPVGTTKDDIAVGIVRPAESDATNTYKAVFFIRDATTGQLNFAWTSWNANTGIDTSTGLFSGTPYENTDIFPGAGIDAGTFTYDGPSRRLVVTDKTAKVITSRTLAEISATPATAPTLTGAVDEAPIAPTAGNQGIDLASAAAVTYGKPVVSKDGKFVVVPVLTDATGVRIVAYSTENIEIDDNNMIDGTTGTPSDMATIMSFDQPGVPTTTNGVIIASLNQVHAWYNAANEKFYWLAYSGSNSEYLYEWDPKTWGVGTAGTADTWVQSGASPNQLKRNITVIGHRADSTAGLYTGKYYTVRKIGPTPGEANAGLWANSATIPTITFNRTTNDYFIRDGLGVHRINVETGYDHNIYSTAGPDGRALALDPYTGWVYFSTVTTGVGVTGIHGYDLASESQKQLLTAPLTPPDFSDGPGGTSGDGNLLYSKNNQTLYYLNVPATVDAGTRPQLFAYKPYCYSIGAANNSIGNLPGFTSQASSWNAEGYSNDN
jgi:hypothetical protein